MELSASLREATERATTLFERGLAGAFRATSGGRLLEVNPALATLLGYDAEETLRGASLQELHADPAEGRAFLARLAGDGERSVEARLRRRDGAPIQALVRARQRRGIDGEEVVEGTVLDLTQVRESEAGLVEAGRLAAVGALAAGVAHEVNSPLAGVLANLAYALEALPAAALDDAGAVREILAALEDARAAAERVRDIVRDLRTFARPEPGEPAPVDVAAVLEATLGLVENQLRHRARVVRALGDAPRVLADPSTLGQVFLNLLLGAAHALPEGAASRNVVQVTLRRGEDGGVQVEIADTRPAAPLEQPSRPSGPDLPARPGGPAGVGLPVARALVASLGGTVAVRTEGRGTTIRVELPAAQTLGPEGAAPLRMARARRRVLVVDDEPVVGKSLRRLLPEHDLALVTSAAEALSALEADPDYDVVLCDLMMPETSGVELFRVLEARFPALARRVVFITGGAFTPEASAFLRTAGTPVLEKPFDLGKLRAVVSGRPAHG